MIDDEALRIEADSILGSPMLENSPTLTALFRYLVEQTLRGADGKLSQHDIAIDGLGRHPSFDETSDCYVRVQASRLRKVLKEYYSSHQPAHGACIYMNPGRYRLRLASFEVAYPNIARVGRERRADRPAPFEPRAVAAIIDPAPAGPASAAGAHGAGSNPGRSDRMLAMVMSGALLLLAVLGGLVAVNTVGTREISAAPVASPPVVAGRISDADGSNDPEIGQLAAALDATVSDHIAKSVVAKEHRGGGEEVPAFLIQITLDRDDADALVADIIVYDQAGNGVFHDRQTTGDGPRALRTMVARDLVSILSPPGIIAGEIDENLPAAPRSGFECMLKIELGRASGDELDLLIDGCEREYRQSDYYPYIAARQMFRALQLEIAETGTIALEGPKWRRLGKLIDRHPDNPFLNMVAAKALLGKGRCREAEPLVQRALVRGANYPGLEQAINVELLGCRTEGPEREALVRRIETIATGYRMPEPLREVYSAIAVTAMNRPDLLTSARPDPFLGGSENELLRVIAELKSAAAGNRSAFTRGDTLRLLLWNPKVRRDTFRNAGVSIESLSGMRKPRLAGPGRVKKQSS